MKLGNSDTVVSSGRKMERHGEKEMRKENLKPNKIFIKIQEKKKLYYNRIEKNLIFKFPKSLVFYALSCQSYGAPEKIKCERRKNIHRASISVQKERKKPDDKGSY